MRSRLGAALAVAAAGAACGAEPTADLVVLTSHGSEIQEVAALAFGERRPGLRVSFRMVDDTEALAQLAAEGAGAGDVWWGASAEALDRAARRGLLAGSAPSWAGSVRAAAVHPDGLWHATVLSPVVLAFNRDLVPLSRAPSDWVDLFHPRWRGDLALPDGATTPSMRVLIAGAMVQELRRVSVEQAGWDWLLRLDAAASGYREEEAELLRDLRTQGSSFALLSAHRVAGLDQPWLAWRVMESGMPFQARGVAVVSGTERGLAAQDFVEVAGGPAVLGATAAAERWIPAVDGVALAVDPYRGRAEALSLWPLAPDTTLARTDEWVRGWGEKVRHLGRRYY